ncbi:MULTISPECIES: hypothetical protein [Paenibacillus]|uniref:hypothetical protein n=1 Tax=Paenibacillus TaxID=44249 RepID=UPI0022B8B20B|nr:hypothetical protein [Paenibacillus caseinilyticus]MCZ8523489.1 hypothetical protein [Paenibacillus caseinilyticus]
MLTGVAALAVWDAAFLLAFAAGSALLWIPLLGRLRMGRGSRLALLLERAKQAGERRKFVRGEERSVSLAERQFQEKASLAGLPRECTYLRFSLLRGGMAASLAMLAFAAQPPASVPLSEWSGGTWMGQVLLYGSCLSAGWWIPMLLVLAAAGHKRTQLLLEIAKLSHRLSVCVSDKADLRDLLVRAGRPLKLLQPHLQELTVLWAKDRHEAIARFRDAVGISEVYPLVNALEAISLAEAKEVAQVLKEQTAGIEAALSSEVTRKLENAPVWISFYIMIPFAVIVLLFLYPWVITISAQLMTSFQG